jgi:hypothetical protein
MVLCTVHRIAPSAEPPAPPKNPEPFLNKDKFDPKKPANGGH